MDMSFPCRKVGNDTEDLTLRDSKHAEFLYFTSYPSQTFLVGHSE